MEILMVLALISIISVFCFPLYSQHIVYEKRVEAEITLNQIATALEHYYLVNNTYQHATLSSLGFAGTTPDQRYQLEITNATENQFQLRANPINQQAKLDSECAVLELNSEGEIKSYGTATTETCWQRHT